MASASGQTFVILGRELEHRRQHMLAADDDYQEERARQRQRRRRRDRCARRANRGLVAARRILKGLFGYPGACRYLGLSGPTEREPWALHFQLGEALWWARNHDAEVEPLHAGAEEEAEACVASLELLHEALRQAIAGVLHGSRDVEAAMLEQRRAMADFDHTYKHVARVLEARLIEIGLPTLADAVRPGVGRRGRPLKQRPKDRYPDLVERMRAGGQVVLDDAPSKAADHGSGQDIAASDVTGNRDAAREGVMTAARDDSAGLEKTEHPFPECSTGEEKIEHPFPERSTGDEKSEQLLPERSKGEEKSPHVLPERFAGGEKSEQPLYKLAAGDASDLVSRLKPSPAVRSCAQDPRRRDLEPRRDISRRPKGKALSRLSAKPVGAESPAWWRRLLRVA